MTTETIRVSPAWLERRESADVAARSKELVFELSRRVRDEPGWLIHDLACGSGAMGRWLAPLLSGTQHWVLHDRDAELLAIAAVTVPGPAADGAEVVVETRTSDITRLGVEALVGATLVTTSALLDLLTRDELAQLVRVCATPGCPVLFTLSVNGRVQLLPPDPLDSRIAAAFNAHQRRSTPRGRLLGPDAVEVAAEAFRRLGANVAVSPSAWRLGAGDGQLAGEWLDGWVAAACEQDPELIPEADRYRCRRLEEAAAGVLAVTVGHADLLVLW